MTRIKNPKLVVVAIAILVSAGTFLGLSQAEATTPASTSHRARGDDHDDAPWAPALRRELHSAPVCRSEFLHRVDGITCRITP